MTLAWFERLKRAIENDGRTAKEISLAAGLGVNYVQQMLSKDQPPKVATLDKLLAALGDKAAATVREDFQSTLGPAIAIKSGELKFGGIAKAGAWRAVDEYFNQDGVRVPDGLLALPKFRKARQYVWKAEGDSMNVAGILDGMWVVGADAGDYVDYYGDIETGDIVVVERARYQGSERELTIKQIRFYRDRYELHPCSTNPEHTPIIVPHDHSPHDDMEIKIVAIVGAAFTVFNTRSR